MATKAPRSHRYHRLLRGRLGLWCGLFFFGFLIMLGRLAWLQLVRGPHYRAEADRYHLRQVTLPAMRGRILDRNHTVLALDDQRHSLFADPTLVRYPRVVAHYLAGVLAMPEDDVLARLTRQLPSVLITDTLPASSVAAVRALGYPELTIVTDPRWQVTIAPTALLQQEGDVRQLATLLGTTRAQVQGLLVPESELARPHDEEDAPTPAPTPVVDVLWPDAIDDATKKALEHAALPGVQWSSLPARHALYADPRVYTAKLATVAAQELAPLTNMPASDIAARLTFRPRFSWLRRDMDDTMYAEVLRLQSTVYVVEPGKLLEGETSAEAITNTVDFLFNLLNPEVKEARKPEADRTWWQRLRDKREPPPARRVKNISKAEIRERLLAGKPGPLLYAPTSAGKPSLTIARALANRPVPGVIYGLPGVSIMEEPRRNYPFGTLAAPTLGYLTDRGEAGTVGVFGLERSQEEVLRGRNGEETKEVDARRLTIPERSSRREPIDGRDIILTIDVNIQQAAEQALATSVEATQALGGTCIVLDPNSGEILALATAPSWDANHPGRSTVTLANPAINHYYEPGSTFKLITVMAALEEGVAHDKLVITNCTGSLPIGRRSVREAHNAHGPVDPRHLLEQSCNIGSAELALRLGAERYVTWLEKLGFGQRTGVELAQESPGTWNAEVAHAKITLANMGFGQSIAVTPLQMAVAYGAAANGGEWVQPHLVKGRVQPDGTIEEATVPRRRVCTPNTGELLCSYLESVVLSGTGGNAKIPGYRVGGKTGTAQKPIPGIGFRSGKYIASFIGVMPINDPQLVIVAVIDEPKGSIYGGTIAAPIVAAVGERALHYLNIPPTEPVTPTP